MSSFQEDPLVHRTLDLAQGLTLYSFSSRSRNDGSVDVATLSRVDLGDVSEEKTRELLSLSEHFCNHNHTTSPKPWKGGLRVGGSTEQPSKSKEEDTRTFPLWENILCLGIIAWLCIGMHPGASKTTCAVHQAGFRTGNDLDSTFFRKHNFIAEWIHSRLKHTR